MKFSHARLLMSRWVAVLAGLILLSSALAASAQDAGGPPPGARPPEGYGDAHPGWKKVLIVGDLHTGNQTAHDSVSHAMAVLERLGRESGAYIAFLRTDTELVSKADVWGTGDYAKGGPRQARGHNLNYFDAVVFYTNGDTDMSEQQKQDLLSFVRDDGKGFVAVHTATATMANWPAYGEMVGGYFDDHPWNIVAVPLIIERPDFPGFRNLPKAPVFTDEMYQYKAPYSRDKIDVLARLDTSQLDLTNKRVHRTDGDFPVAWIKSYGKGRVFCSTFGHSDQSWDDPRVQKLYLEAIKWAVGLTDYPVQPHPMDAATKP
jgi:type 1 glutamine amidotransferase